MTEKPNNTTEKPSRLISVFSRNKIRHPKSSGSHYLCGLPVLETGRTTLRRIVLIEIMCDKKIWTLQMVPTVFRRSYQI
jgi:hypothetical protein